MPSVSGRVSPSHGTAESRMGSTVHTFVPGPEKNTFHASRVIKDSIDADGLMPDMAHLRRGAHIETSDEHKKNTIMTNDKRSTQDFDMIDFLRGSSHS